jgi:hypothetical protein
MSAPYSRKPTSRSLAGALLPGFGLPAAANPQSVSDAAVAGDSFSELVSITVTAERLPLIGIATTASEGVVVNDEFDISPNII